MDPINELSDLTFSQTAWETCKRLRPIFEEFAATLKDDEEMGVALTTFGVTRVLFVTSVHAFGPNLIVVDGLGDNSPVRLVQHVSQLSFLLTREKRQQPSESRRVIGFYQDR